MALPELLSTLTESLTSALDALPSPTTLAAPDDGLSLLSTKNELLLSYLQNLIFLIVLKLRALAADPAPPNPTPTPLTTTDTAAADPFHDAVIQNLVALGVYLEKGVRPLESRLGYQLDKLLLAASEASPPSSKPALRASSAHASRSPSLSPAPSSSRIPPLAHRPNPTSLVAPPARARRQSPSSTRYRPPRMTPTAPPGARATGKETEQRARRARKSATMEEFVREEMGDAPVAEPSVGAGSALRGREADRERERSGYEEGRLVRLGGEKRGAKRGREKGEEWLGVGWEGEGDGDGGVGEGRRKKKVRVGRKRGGAGVRGRR